MKKLLLLTVIFLGLGIQSFAQTTIQPSDSKIQYFGRWDWSGGNPKCTWPSLYLKAKFTGTSIKAKFTNTFYNNEYLVHVLYTIDGGEPVYVNNVTEFTVNNLSAGEHEIMISRRMEGNGADLIFDGFEITGGNLVAPNPRPCAKFEFVGNSITCGLANENFSATWNDGKGTWIADGWEQNSYRSYAPVLSRMMDAEYRIESHSGQGMYINLNNSLPEAKASDEWELVSYYPGWAKTGWETKHNFAADDWDPDFFFTLLGTNDWSDNNYNQGLITIEAYKARYKEFINLVFATYPNTTFMVVTPILNVRGWADGSTAHAQLVAELQAEGKDVHLINLENVLVTQQDFGNDWTHPTTKGHQTMANSMESQMLAIPSVAAKLNSIKQGCSPCDDCGCDNVANSGAYYDDCGVCVEGTTGKDACTQTCDGVWGGSAYIDNCGDCVKGSTGLPDCEEKACTRAEFDGELNYSGMVTGSDKLSNSFENNAWKMTCNGTGTWDAGVLTLPNPIDITASPEQKLWIRIKASGKALVVPSLADGTGRTTGNSELSGWNSPTAEGKTSIETTTSWQEYTIDFSNKLYNEWESASCPCDLDATNITNLYLSVNPGHGTQWPPAYKDGTEITEGFTGTIEIDYMILGYEQCDITGTETPSIKTINLYPNPAQNFVKMDIDDINAEWTVINTLGEVVITGKGTFIDTSILTDGVYFIRGNDGLWNGKFVKK